MWIWDYGKIFFCSFLIIFGKVRFLETNMFITCQMGVFGSCEFGIENKYFFRNFLILSGKSAFFWYKYAHHSLKCKFLSEFGIVDKYIYRSFLIIFGKSAVFWNKYGQHSFKLRFLGHVNLGLLINIFSTIFS